MLLEQTHRLVTIMETWKEHLETMEPIVQSLIAQTMKDNKELKQQINYLSEYIRKAELANRCKKSWFKRLITKIVNFVDQSIIVTATVLTAVFLLVFLILKAFI
jgi:hypothetical protein